MKIDPLQLAEVRRMASSGEARRIREKNHLSRAEIGTPIGVDQSTVARWESGARLPRGTAAIRYLGILKALTSSGRAA